MKSKFEFKLSKQLISSKFLTKKQFIENMNKKLKSIQKIETDADIKESEISDYFVIQFCYE